MGSEARELHIFFFPFLSQGHIIPTIDMARLFAARGVNSTIITTPLNKPLISQTLHKTTTMSHNHHRIHVRTIEFPAAAAELGLPQGCERMDSSLCPTMIITFVKATAKLQQPLENLLQQERPHCLVADMFFPWATESAAKFNIPRLVFHGTGLFSLCASLCVTLHEPYRNVSSDSEPFLVPELPGGVTMTRGQLTELRRIDDEEGTMGRVLKESRESEVRSFGIVANTFHELESAYAHHYSNVFGRRIWNVGPLSLCNRNNEEKAQRGNEGSVNEHHHCLNWLESKKPNSVVYICFGSMWKFGESQIAEIAMGVEASGVEFIWVVKEERLPQGFEKRTEGKGLIVRGWAPQVLILDHVAVGGFVTHCGWNSVLEGVAGGVPMVTWPLCAEQFYNEKLICDVLKIGVPVGAQYGDAVKRDAIEGAVKGIMGGGEIRERAKWLALRAREAVEVGGSSHSDLDSLIKELQSC